MINDTVAYDEECLQDYMTEVHAFIMRVYTAPPRHA